MVFGKITEVKKDTGEEIDFLVPKKDAEKDSKNDPLSEENLKKTAYQMTMKAMNAVKIVSPIIIALLKQPAEKTTNENLSKGFKDLIKEISSLSIQLCEQMDIDPKKEKNFWIRNVLEKHFAEIVSEQYVKNGDINHQFNQEHLCDIFKDIMKNSEQVAEKIPYEDLSAQDLVKMACIKAMLPILKESIHGFDLYRNIENDIDFLMEKLFNASKQALDVLSDEYASKNDRAKLFYILMQEAGAVYANSWHQESKRVFKLMEQYPKEKLEKALEKYRNQGGLPLDKLNDDFDKYFSKLVVISDKLIKNSSGNMQSRLNVKTSTDA